MTDYADILHLVLADPATLVGGRHVFMWRYGNRMGR